MVDTRVVAGSVLLHRSQADRTHTAKVQHVSSAHIGDRFLPNHDVYLESSQSPDRAYPTYRSSESVVSSGLGVTCTCSGLDPYGCFALRARRAYSTRR